MPRTSSGCFLGDFCWMFLKDIQDSGTVTGVLWQKS